MVAINSIVFRIYHIYTYHKPSDLWKRLKARYYLWRAIRAGYTSKGYEYLNKAARELIN